MKQHALLKSNKSVTKKKIIRLCDSRQRAKSFHLLSAHILHSGPRGAEPIPAISGEDREDTQKGPAWNQTHDLLAVKRQR